MDPVPDIGTAPRKSPGHPHSERTRQIQNLVRVAADNKGEWVSAHLEGVSPAAGPEVYTRIGRHLSEVTFRDDVLYIRIDSREEV